MLLENKTPKISPSSFKSFPYPHLQTVDVQFSFFCRNLKVSKFQNFFTPLSHKILWKLSSTVILCSSKNIFLYHRIKSRENHVVQRWYNKKVIIYRDPTVFFYYSHTLSYLGINLSLLLQRVVDSWLKRKRRP